MGWLDRFGPQLAKTAALPLILANCQSGIEFVGVEFSYRRSTPAIVSNISLLVPPGEFFVLVGPSGCGKTTILNLVAGFIKPTAGTVRVGTQTVTGPGIDRLVVFQGEDSLLGWRTVLQNVEFGLYLAGTPKKERSDRAMAAIQVVGLAGHEHKYPRELSGGMKQRVQIARALVCESPVLLMDEPFGAVDAMTRTILQDEVARLWEERPRTILFITHDIAEAVTLGGTIGVMGGPAGHDISLIRNELRRPRSRQLDGFGRMYGAIEAALKSSAQSVSGQRDFDHPHGTKTSPANQARGGRLV